MIRLRVPLAALLGFVFVVVPAFAQAPPVGGNQPVQVTKTGNYTITTHDLKTTIPFSCPSGCIVTFPASTSKWPKGYATTIVNSGASGTVTIHATAPSGLSGMPTTGGDILLTAQGNFATVSADKSNNFVAFGVTGTGGTGGGGTLACAMMADANNAIMVDATTAILVNSGDCAGGAGGGGTAMMVDTTNAILASPGIAILVQ